MRYKLKSLLQDWPYLGVMTSAALSSRDISPNLVRSYVQSGYLTPLAGEGAFSRAGQTPTWQGAVFALQTQLKIPIHVGGRSRLQLEGLLHHAMLGEQRVHLYGSSGTRLPKWFRDEQWSFPDGSRVKTAYSTPRLFSRNLGIEEKDWGGFKLQASTLERATLELLYSVMDQSSFLEAEADFPTVNALNVEKMQRLLESCQSRRVKRLFLYLAEKQDWPEWFSKLKLKRVDLGSGPLSIAKAGKYISKWMIQVPAPWLENVTV